MAKCVSAPMESGAPSKSPRPSLHMAWSLMPLPAMARQATATVVAMAQGRRPPQPISELTASGASTRDRRQRREARRGMGARRGAGALHMADGLNPPGICGTIWGGGHGLSPWEDGLAREGQLRLELQRGRSRMRLERASGHVTAGREKCNRGCMDGWGGNRQGTA